MQAVSTASLFQSAESEELGTHRSAKAQVVCGAGEESQARYGYPVQLNPAFDPHALVSEGAGADGGRYRVLASKISADQRFLYTAEAGGVVRQLDLELGKTVNVLKGAQGPVPTLDLFTTEVHGQVSSSKEGSVQWLVTGAWDKAVRLYILAAANRTRTTPIFTLANAMDDFIKCVHVFSATTDRSAGDSGGAEQMLAVAGSDKSVKIFHLPQVMLDHLANSSAADDETHQLRCAYQLKAHTRPVNVLASLTGLDSVTRIYSADSMGRILESVWDSKTRRLEVQREIVGFQTAVYDLRVFWATETVEGEMSDTKHRDDDDPWVSAVEEVLDGSLVRRVAVLWAASADKSVAGYFLSSKLSSRRRPVAATAKADMISRAASLPMQGTLPPLTRPFAKVVHPDYVKAVLPLSLFPAPAISSTLNFPDGVVTGSSDDQLRFFPHASRSRRDNDDEEDDDDDDDAGRGDKHVYEIEGHWNEITCLQPWIRPPAAAVADKSSMLPSPTGDAERWIVSTGLDGSVRRWNVDKLTSFPPPRFTSSSSSSSSAAVADMHSWNADSLPTDIKQRTPTTAASFQMTAEEEAELADLMDSD